MEVEQLWEGIERGQFESLVGALNEAGIRYHWTEHVRPRFKLEFSSIPLRLRSTSQYQVRVFRSDLETAKQKIEGLFEEPELDSLN